MIKKLLFTLISLVCITQNTTALIINAATFTKTMPGGHTQYMHILGDAHTENPYTQQQKNDFISFIKQLNPLDTLLIIEDAAYINPDWARAYSTTKSHMQEFLKNYFLRGLIWLCEEQGMTTSCSELRNYTYHTSLETFFARHHDPLIKEIETYNDNPQLNAYYHNVLKRMLRHEGTFLTQLRDQPKELTLHIADKAPLFNSRIELLDARIVHTIYNSSHKEHIILCIGDGHKNNIELLLPELGYSEQRNTSTTSKDLITLARDRQPVALRQLEEQAEHDKQHPININNYFSAYVPVEKTTQDMQALELTFEAAMASLER